MTRRAQTSSAYSSIKHVAQTEIGLASFLPIIKQHKDSFRLKFIPGSPE